MRRCLGALEHEPTATVDFVPRTAKRSIGYRSFHPIGQIAVEHPRQPLPEPVRPHRTVCGTGGSIDKNDLHRVLSKLHVLLHINVHANPYKFETERRPFS
jgi:hypothetical protein